MAFRPIHLPDYIMFAYLKSTVFASAALIGLAWFTPVLAAADTASLDGLEWRNVGPWRGGRVTAVTGVPGQPLVYYMGATGGGVWKTENAGRTWTNLSDGFFEVGTIGAIAVAESDPNVIYVGTGEAPIRGVTTSHGDGVWKSTDGGRTWTHIGLEDSGQIANVRHLAGILPNIARRCFRPCATSIRSLASAFPDAARHPPRPALAQLLPQPAHHPRLLGFQDAGISKSGCFSRRSARWSRSSPAG